MHARALPSRIIQTEHGTIELLDLTPAVAEQLLANPHPRQRLVREAHVTAIAHAIETGAFRFLGDSIKLDSLGQLVDGQHRLHAVVRTGKTIKDALLVRLADEDVFRYIDTGSLPRTTSDILRSDGYVVPKSVCGAILLEKLGFDRWAPKGVSKVEYVAIVTECPVLDDIIALYRLGRGLRVTAGPLAGAIAALKKNRPQAIKFFSAVFANDYVIDGVPEPMARLLAHWLAFHRDDVTRGDRHDTQIEGACKTVRAWNAWRGGERLARLSLPKSGEVPEAYE